MAAPLQTALITPFPFGVSSFGMPLVGDDVPTTGRVFFVDSTSSNKGDDTTHGGSPTAPFATLDFAIGQCTANRGDRIYLLPGHAENVSSAAGINCDVAGTQIFGMGGGRDRARFTFISSTAASLDINAASVWIRNVVFDLTGIDAVGTGGAGAGGIRVQASDAIIESCEIILANVSNQAANAIGLNTNANRCRILGNLIAGTATAGPVSAIYVYGAGALTLEGVEIGWNRIVGDFSTAAIVFNLTDVVLNAFIHDNKVTATGSAQTALLFPSLGAGSSGIVANNRFLGTSLDVVYGGGAGMASIENYGYDIDTTGVNGVIVPRIGSALPAGASIVDQVLGDFNGLQANYSYIDVDFSGATWNTVATHQLLSSNGEQYPSRVVILPVITTALTSGGAATIKFGTASNSGNLIAATAVASMLDGCFWLSATPAKKFAASAVLDFVAVEDIGYEVETAAFTGGVIRFHIWKIALNNNGTILSSIGTGNGGPM